VAMKKRLFLTKSIQIGVLTVNLLSSCSDKSQNKFYNPNNVDLKTIDSLVYIAAHTANDPIIKRDSADIVDTIKNEIIGYYSSEYYINKKRGSLDYVIRENHFDGYSISYLIEYWNNKPISGEKSVWYKRKGVDDSQHASFYFYNEKLYENRRDSIVLSDDSIKNLAVKVLQDYSKLQ
jgi:hypothetical protein